MIVFIESGNSFPGAMGGRQKSRVAKRWALRLDRPAFQALPTSAEEKGCLCTSPPHGRGCRLCTLLCTLSTDAREGNPSSPVPTVSCS